MCCIMYNIICKTCKVARTTVCEAIIVSLLCSCPLSVSINAAAQQHRTRDGITSSSTDWRWFLCWSLVTNIVDLNFSQVLISTNKMKNLWNDLMKNDINDGKEGRRGSRCLRSPFPTLPFPANTHRICHKHFSSNTHRICHKHFSSNTNRICQKHFSRVFL